MEEYILVVDDSPTVRAAAEFALSEADFKVKTAINGLDGLKQLESTHLEGDKTAMIISDVNMPEMDGLTFVKTVKKTLFKSIPVLFLTTESQSSLKEEGKKAGAVGWLIKPFTPNQLSKVISKFVNVQAPLESKKKTDENVLLKILSKELSDLLAKIKEVQTKLLDTPDNAELFDRLFNILHYIRISASFLGSTRVSKFQSLFETKLHIKAKEKEYSLTKEQNEMILSSVELSDRLLKAELAGEDTSEILKEIEAVENGIDDQF